MTIDGKNSTYGHSGNEWSTDCVDLNFTLSPHFKCSDTSGGTVLLNPDTKLAVISEGLGGIVMGEYRDTVQIRLLQCTKF